MFDKTDQSLTNVTGPDLINFNYILIYSARNWIINNLIKSDNGLSEESVPRTG